MKYLITVRRSKPDDVNTQWTGCQRMHMRIFHCSGLGRRVVWCVEQKLQRRVFSVFSVVRVFSWNVLKMVAHNSRNVYNHLVRRHTPDHWSVYRHNCASLKSRTNECVDVTFERFVAQCRVAPEATMKVQWILPHAWELCVLQYLD